MREIGFRAWDIKSKRMEDVKCLNFNSMQPEFNDDTWDWYQRERILMQYTGFKDKNGKEIYEGDILKDNGHERYVWIVSYENGSFVGVQSNCKTWNVNLSTLLKYPLKVIGNIYGNPELLKEVTNV